MNNVNRAFYFAYTAHFHQKRKNSGEPYICHPVRVLHIIQDQERESGKCLSVNSPCLYVACLLHDTLEDTDATEKEILEEFGENSAKLVLELTNPSSKLPEGTARAIKKEMDFAHIRGISNDAKTIKLADRIDNLRDIQDMGWKFSMKYLGESETLLSICGPACPELAAKLKEVIRIKYEYWANKNRPE